MSLKSVFAEAGITCAHVIDDAYDNAPTVAATDLEAQEFLDNADENALEAIGAVLGIKDAGEEQVRAALLDLPAYLTLYSKRTELGGVGTPLFQSFETAQQTKLAQIEPLVKLLEENEVTCHRFGADYDLKDSPEPQLFFVDLRLNEQTSDIGHEDAVKVYQKLKAIHGGCKPFVFLMSSLSTRLPGQREDFRKATDLFQSEFEDIDKKSFEDSESLSRLLMRYTKVIPQLGVLRQYMEHVQQAVALASANVMKEMRSLDLVDYFVLYHNTTSVEKVGLGSYVIETLLEFLAHEVEGTDQIWNLSKALDDLDIKTLPRARFGLTFAAAHFYSASMLHANKRLLAEESLKRGPAQGYFYLGDLFFEAKELNEAMPTKAFAVITPACDLIRPEKLEGRSILLCEGSVREVKPGTIPSGTDSLPAVVMQHPRDEKRQLLIEWSKKTFHVWHDAERAKFSDAEQCHYVRVARLRALYAIQLQHAVTADLSRVGTQRPPSLLVPHGLKCFVSDGETWTELYSNGNGNAAALSDGERNGKKYTLYVLTDPAIQQILMKLSTWIKANAGATNNTTLSKLLTEDGIEEALMYFDHRVPEKSVKGEEFDSSAYPLFDFAAFPNNEKKIVAIARSRSSSPYAQIAAGHKVTAKQFSRLVFRLETVDHAL